MRTKHDLCITARGKLVTWKSHTFTVTLGQPEREKKQYLKHLDRAGLIHAQMRCLVLQTEAFVMLNGWYINHI